jgi:hypothetical protein
VLYAGNYNRPSTAGVQKASWWCWSSQTNFGSRSLNPTKLVACAARDGDKYCFLAATPHHDEKTVCCNCSSLEHKSQRNVIIGASMGQSNAATSAALKVEAPAFQLQTLRTSKLCGLDESQPRLDIHAIHVSLG